MKWKSIAHRVFDPLWRDGHMKRKEAYKALAEVMNIHPMTAILGCLMLISVKKFIQLHEWTNQEGDIMIDNTSILALTDIIQLPEAERHSNQG